MVHNDYYVYIHRRGDNNEVFYVGKGKGKRSTSRKNRNKWWISIVAKYGYTVEILECELGESSAFDLEVETIKFYRECGHILCNLTDGGEGASGRIHTSEAKAKISAARAGKPLSDTHKESLRKANIGIPKTEDQLKAMREAQKARTKPVYCSNGNRYDSVRQAIEHLNSIGFDIKYSAYTYSCIKGKLKLAHGFSWSYEPFIDTCC